MHYFASALNFICFITQTFRMVLSFCTEWCFPSAPPHTHIFRFDFSEKQCSKCKHLKVHPLSILFMRMVTRMESCTDPHSSLQVTSCCCENWLLRSVVCFLSFTCSLIHGRNYLLVLQSFLKDHVMIYNKCLWFQQIIAYVVLACFSLFIFLSIFSPLDVISNFWSISF